MAPFMALALIATISLLAETGFLVMRKNNQRRADAAQITWELHFPRSLTMDQATAAFDSLGGVFKRLPNTLGLTGRPSLTVEVWGQEDGLHHRVTFPRGLEQSLRSHFRSAIPAIAISDSERPDVAWSLSAELRRPAGHTTTPSPTLVPVLLSSLRCGEGETAVVQYVITTTGKKLDEADAPAFLSIGRLAVAAPSDEAAGALMQRLVVAYRSLNIFAHTLPTARKSKAVTRHATPHTWTAHMQSADLVVAAAIPVGAPNVAGLTLERGRRFAPEPVIPSIGTVIGEAGFHGQERPVAIAESDRTRHQLLLASTGGGKSTMIINSFLQDAEAGFGAVLVDPNGDLAEAVLDRVPAHRHDDVIVLDVASPTPIGFNILGGSDVYAMTGNFMATLNRLYDFESKTPRAWNLLRPTLLSLAAMKLTLVEMPLMLDPGRHGMLLRDAAIRQLDNPGLADYWRHWEALAPKEKVEQAAPILHRLSGLYMYPSVRQTLGQTVGLSMEEVLRERRILIVPAAKGVLGDEVARIVAGLVIGSVWQAAIARPVAERTTTMVYIDEVATMLAGSPVPFEELFSQARKYALGFTVAGQFLDQMKTGTLKQDVLANVRNKLIWPTNATDAATLAREMGGSIEPDDILGLGSHELVARLSIDERMAEPVTVKTSPEPPSRGTAHHLRALSSLRYGRSSVQIEEEIKRRQRNAMAPPNSSAGRDVASFEESASGIDFDEEDQS